jgi:hypothetical protein
MGAPVVFFSLFVPVFLIMMVIGVALAVFPVWWMFKRAGIQPALSLLILVPVLGWGVLIWFAHAEWPAEKQVLEVRP